MYDQHCISTQGTRCVVNAMGFFAQGIRCVINAVGVGVLLLLLLLFLFLFLFFVVVCLFLFVFGVFFFLGGGCQGNKVCDQCYGGWCFLLLLLLFFGGFFVVVFFFFGGGGVAKGTKCVINAMAAFFLRNNVCGDTASLPREQVMNTAFLRRKEGV